MKKLISIVFILMAAAWSLPAFTLLPRREEPEKTEPSVTSTSSRDIAAYFPMLSHDRSMEITLRHGDETMEMSLRDYLVGVVAAEMPASFPEEALKAQAVAARTYCMYKLMLIENGQAPAASHMGAMFCSDHSHCEAFYDLDTEDPWGESREKYLPLIENAVDSTDGVIAVWQDEPIVAVFHSASGPRTEASENVWGGSLPYLVSVESPGGEASAKYYGEKRISIADFRSLVSAALPGADLTAAPEEWFKASVRSEGGGIITVKLGGKEVKGTFVRSLLGLASTNFTYRVEGDELVFSTTGTGHGVGMSQYGARYMALEGADYEEIICRYYTGVELKKLEAE